MTVAVYLWHGHPTAQEYSEGVSVSTAGIWRKIVTESNMTFFFYEPDIYIVAITSSYPILAKNTSRPHRVVNENAKADLFQLS